MATTSILERILEVVNERDKLGYTIFKGITEPYPCRSIDTVQKTEGLMLV